MTTARSFLRGIVDYAGLFPPAQVEMSAAVKAYAEYRSSADHDLLGRFVVPVMRLEELAEELSRLSPGDGSAWQLSAIADDAGEAAATISRFNAAHADRAVCDTVEMRVGSAHDITRAVETLPETAGIFLEIASDDPRPLVHAIAERRASAKLRTGGVVESAIPDSSEVLRFMRACIHEGVAFKATAGLHHLIRGRYPLTYEPRSQTATMFGFLNIFAAAALCASGSADAIVIGALEETDPREFGFDDDGLSWRGNVVLHEQLDAVRQNVAVSFGSCSFTEPVAEAKALHII